MKILNEFKFIIEYTFKVELGTISHKIVSQPNDTQCVTQTPTPAHTDATVMGWMEQEAG